MDKEQALAKVGLFETLNPKFLKGIAGICTERSFKPGEYLMKQGESGIGLFIILSGRVRIEKTDASGKEVEIAENGPGDIMGEMAVFDGSPRSASVKAVADTSCLVLASWEFNSFLKAHPEAALELLPIVVKRFRETNDALVGLRSMKN
ncbi:MAG TPA: cyclic nucleotide-binding domain-containing protein [Spirochaetia bacterium]|nr:cyclic nucleotide-binding domain-containing protein [Spirochaetales bacterium]HRY73676.1 cyclic nucleotide-binding domain-containing protein [Spirochaetia bacterium]